MICIVINQVNNIYQKDFMPKDTEIYEIEKLEFVTIFGKEVLFDCEQRSKVLKEAMLLFFLLFLFLAWWKHEQKTFHIEQKMFAIKVL